MLAVRCIILLSRRRCFIIIIIRHGSLFGTSVH
jgi:hypothetical protein